MGSEAHCTLLSRVRSGYASQGPRTMARDACPTRLLVPSSVGFALGPVLLVLDIYAACASVVLGVRQRPHAGV
jgi:hypothetical protein